MPIRTLLLVFLLVLSPTNYAWGQGYYAPNKYNEMQTDADFSFVNLSVAELMQLPKAQRQSINRSARQKLDECRTNASISREMCNKYRDIVSKINPRRKNSKKSETPPEFRFGIKEPY